MLELRFIRENPDVVKKDLKRRGYEDWSARVDSLLGLDAEHRKLIGRSQELRAMRNNLAQEINELKKQGKDIAAKVQEAKRIPGEIKKIEETISGQGISLDEALNLRGMTRKDLEKQISTQKIVEKILASKILLTDQEVKDYFNANKTLFGQNPVFDKVKDQVRAQLFQQKLSEQYNTWITDLKTKAKILYFINL